jgi:hypothetical protein
MTQTEAIKIFFIVFPLWLYQEPTKPGQHRSSVRRVWNCRSQPAFVPRSMPGADHGDEPANIRRRIEKRREGWDGKMAVSSQQSRPARLRHWIERLGPYQSLLLLTIPASIVEPLKLAAVAIAGSGRWITGTITILCAYAASLFCIERLFRMVKPKLLTLPWFTRVWNWLLVLRRRTLEWSRRLISARPNLYRQ